MLRIRLMRLLHRGDIVLCCHKAQAIMQKLLEQAPLNSTNGAQSIKGEVDRAMVHGLGNPVLAFCVWDGADSDIVRTDFGFVGVPIPSSTSSAIPFADDRTDSAEVNSPFIYRAGQGNAVIACRVWQETKGSGPIVSEGLIRNLSDTVLNFLGYDVGGKHLRRRYYD